jgi:hypothetical protein
MEQGAMIPAYLQEKPSFLRGLGAVMDLTASSALYHYYLNQHSDFEALRSDWYQIGADIHRAMLTHDREVHG